MQKQVRLIEFQAPFVESFWNTLFAAALGLVAVMIMRVMSKPEEGTGVFIVALICALLTGWGRSFRLRKQVCKLEQALNEGGSGEGDRR